MGKTHSATCHRSLEAKMIRIRKGCPHPVTQPHFEGKLWTDAEDFAIVKIAGHPAKKPSFCSNRADFVRQYHNRRLMVFGCSDHPEDEIANFLGGRSSSNRPVAPESNFQYRRKPALCQRTIVSGLTKMSETASNRTRDAEQLPRTVGRSSRGLDAECAASALLIADAMPNSQGGDPVAS
jgi:hypothetical protein